MKAIIRLLLPLLLPILISVLPFIILRDERNRALQLAGERLKRSWHRQAEFIAQQFRSNCSIEKQIQNQTGTLKHLLQQAARRQLETRHLLTSQHFLRSYHQAFPPRRHPNGRVFWNPASESLLLAFIPDGDSRVKALPTSSLPSYRLRPFTRLMNEMLQAPRLSKQELTSKDSISKAVFGAYCQFEMIALTQKGIPTPVHFMDQRSFIVWDTIEVNGKRMGAFLLIFSESIETRGRPLRHA
ncbi:MAG TPA: hypothetical protein PKO06_04135, partial [Candidatus Ozemobacteraceae bacterium]|nr:hypothetical protein [Candidatus Ozemobacteraceae bacterium]